MIDITKGLIENAKVTVGIPTKGRYDTLSNTLMSIAFQTVKPSEVIVVDDNDNPTDLREIPTYQAIFKLFDRHEISWHIVFGRKMGQHHSHQIVNEIAKHPIVWRIDDDEIADPNVLEVLLSHWKDGVGAVGGLVPQEIRLPILHDVGKDAQNKISDLSKPNLQWFFDPSGTVREVEHLTSSFIYRKGVVSYDLSLSKAAFREETIFTYELFRKGLKLIIDPNIITWHFRGSNRHQNIQDWENDDKYFASKLAEWGVNQTPSKMIVCDCGIGDEIVVASLVPELKNKYGKITIACCHRPVFEEFEGEDVTIVSIAEARQRLGSIDHLNIYKNMIDWNWQTELKGAFRKLYGI